MHRGRVSISQRFLSNKMQLTPQIPLVKLIETHVKETLLKISKYQNTPSRIHLQAYIYDRKTTGVQLRD